MLLIKLGISVLSIFIIKRTFNSFTKGAQLFFTTNSDPFENINLSLNSDSLVIADSLTWISAYIIDIFQIVSFSIIDILFGKTKLGRIVFGVILILLLIFVVALILFINIMMYTL